MALAAGWTAHLARVLVLLRMHGAAGRRSRRPSSTDVMRRRNACMRCNTAAPPPPPGAEAYGKPGVPLISPFPTPSFAAAGVRRVVHIPRVSVWAVCDSIPALHARAQSRAAGDVRAAVPRRDAHGPASGCSEAGAVCQGGGAGLRQPGTHAPLHGPDTGRWVGRMAAVAWAEAHPIAPLHSPHVPRPCEHRCHVAFARGA